MIVDFWAILVFAIICIVFLILFSSGRKSSENQLDTQFENKDANFMLQSFLRAPALGVDQTKTVAEIIAEDDIRNDFASTEKLFGEFFKGMKDYNVYLSIEGAHKENFKKRLGQNIIERTIIVPSGTPTPNVMILPKGEEYDAVTYIPGYEKRIQLKLEIDETVKMNNEEVTQDG